MFGADPPPVHLTTDLKGPVPSEDEGRTGYLRHLWSKLFVIVERTSTTALAVYVSVTIPEFSSMMAFLGSFSAFMICVIGPIFAKMSITGKREPFDILLLCVSIVMATMGKKVIHKNVIFLLITNGDTNTRGAGGSFPSVVK